MQDASWYLKLAKPSWAPSPQLFGQAWGLLYPIIFAVNIYVLILLAQSKISWKIALPFWLNLALNFLYVITQFQLGSQILSSIDIVLLLLSIVWCMVVIWPVSKAVALLYLPYLLWVSLATVLQISLAVLNS